MHFWGLLADPADTEVLEAVFASRSPGGGANSRRGHYHGLPFHQP